MRGAKERGSISSPGAGGPGLAAFHGDGGEDITTNVASSREERLLPENWLISTVNGSKSNIQIRMQGLPAGSNPLHVEEFSHVVRGLLLAKPETYDPARLQCIDLITCFSGFGGKKSFAQRLANELQVEVRSYPTLDNQAVSLRHPSWLQTNTVIACGTGEMKNRYNHASGIKNWKYSEENIKRCMIF